MSTIKANEITAVTDDTDITITGAGSGVVKLGDGALKFPDSDGSAGQFIKTDGSAQLSFAAASGGVVLQVIEMSIAEASGSTTIPYDDTLPAVGEGTEIGSQAIVMADDTNKVLITGAVTVGQATSTRKVIIAIFRGSVCVTTRYIRPESGGNHAFVMPFAYLDSTATSGSVTYSARIGQNTGNTWYVGTDSGGIDMGNTTFNGIILQEIAV